MVTTNGADSSGYGGFNLALHVGDDAAKVRANRKRLQRQIGADSLQWLQQVHSNRVVEISSVLSDEPQADAVYSTARGIGLAVLTADCLPVLFCDRRGSAIAAAHAGWRGLASGILTNTVACFDQAPGELMAWLGPAIGPSNFEVGPEVRAAFSDNPGLQCLNAAFTPSPREGHYYCDLYALARCNLQAAGVQQIYGGDYCTYGEQARFYSYRRQGVCGRMATIIFCE
jgi:YfiH family protein